MKKQLLFYFFIVSFIKLSAQKHRTFLYAEVKDKIDFVYNAHVVNLSTKQGTFTNEEGKFRVLAKENDSLQISFVGYKTVFLVVKMKHFGMQKNTIELTKIIYELDEVALKKNNLLGYLSTDSKNMKLKKEVNAETLNLPFAGSRILSQAERRLHTATSSSGGIAIDPIINWISGRTKKLKFFKVIEDREKRIKSIYNSYHIYIEKELKILTEDIFEFIYYSEASKDFTNKLLKNEIDMIHFFKKKSITFKKLNPNDYN